MPGPVAIDPGLFVWLARLTPGDVRTQGRVRGFRHAVRGPFTRDAADKFHVLVVTIERHEATVVQATVAPEVLARLMSDPGEMGKALTEDATIDDN